MKKFLALVLLIVSLIGCNDNGSNKESQVSTLNINLSEEGKTIDPQLATDVPSSNLLGFVEQGLVIVDENLNFVPGLAKTWEVSSDGLVYTFHLRDNLKWSDGTPLTVQDFKFAWIRALNPETASEYAYILYYIKNAENYNSGKVGPDEVGIKVIDDKTLQVTLAAPTPYFPSLTALSTYYPLNKEFYEKHRDNYALEPEYMLYCGPYKMISWTHNSEIILEKNPYYFDSKNVKIDRINIKYIADSGSILNAFENNELDVISLTPEQYEKFKNDPRIQIKVKNVVWYLQYNVTKKVLSNPKIREAILLGIDKDKIVDTVFKGTVTPAYSMTPANVGIKGIKDDFVVEMGTKIPKFNVELAKKLLTEGMQEEGITTMPELSLLINPSGSNKKVAEVIQEDLRKNLGLTVNIEAKEFKERLARMQSGNFDVVLAGWSADYQDPMTYLDLFATNSGNNGGKYKNLEYDKLVDLAKKEVDPIKRNEYMREIEGIIAQEYPVGPLFNSTSIYLVNPKLKGMIFSAFGPAFILKNATISTEN